MTTHNIKVTGTDLSPFNLLDNYDICDAGYILDPMAQPLSFYYPLSVTGGFNVISYKGNFSVFEQELSPQSIFFKSDGKKMYILGTISDRVYEYILNVPWDVTTSKYITNNFYSINSQENVPTGLFFRDNGLSMYLLGVNSDSVYQYTLTNSWDVSSASYSSKFFSVGSQQSQPRGIYFKPDGSAMFVVGTVDSKITQYSLATPWDISTAYYSTKFFSVSNQEENPEGISFKSDGTKTFVIGSSARVIEYNLTTPWDITTCSYTSAYFPVSSKDFHMKDLYFTNDGKRLFLIGNEMAKSHSYVLNDNWVLSGWDTRNYSSTIYGGRLSIGYNDLSNIKQKIKGEYVFCQSEVIFDFSEFDESRSKIIKFIFDPNNGNDVQIFSSYIDENNVLVFPNLSSIKTEYYPTESFYTFYNPNFILEYIDGTTLNITIPITSVQCGIYESYKNKRVLESLPYYKNNSNVFVFVNDIYENNIHINDIYTKLPFVLSANLPEKDIELPNIIRAVPIGSTLESIIEPLAPLPRTNKNPVLPPIPIIIYSEYNGISIVTNNSIFTDGDIFESNNSLTLLGTSPYSEGIGISISIITDLNN